MRIGRAARSGIACATVAALFFAGCVDLFHSTDFPALCDSDPRAAGCLRVDAAAVVDASKAADAEASTGIAVDAAETSAPPQPTDFCAWDSAAARAKAEHACAWLGSCAGPVGDNALGACMINALLAYDCRINPARKVQGRLHAYWDCLSVAATCDAVGRCVSPDGPEACSASGAEYSSCGGTVDGGFPGNASVRVACTSGGSVSATENCLAIGQTCIVRGSFSACTGRGSVDASCAGLACDGTLLRDCSGGTDDLGVDCALYGNGQCVGFDGGGASCAASSSTGCDAGGPVRCSDAGAAIGCPSGVEETIDCAALLGGDGGACAPGASGPTWDLSRACVATGACSEGCVGTTVARGCSHGATFDVDCSKVGLTSCGTFTFDGKMRAACKP